MNEKGVFEPDKFAALIAKLDELKVCLERAARLKRRYEYTIGFLAATAGCVSRLCREAAPASCHSRRKVRLVNAT